MTGPDNFILRWARLKRASDPAHERDTASADAKITPAQPLAEGVPDEPFDLASLPSIESIAGDTDVGAFLQSGVPAELARAALRRAWANDPAIRDFVGVAENQWDFNLKFLLIRSKFLQRPAVLPLHEIERALAFDLLEPQIGIVIGGGDGGSFVDRHGPNSAVISRSLEQQYGKSLISAARYVVSNVHLNGQQF